MISKRNSMGWMIYDEDDRKLTSGKTNQVRKDGIRSRNISSSSCVEYGDINEPDRLSPLLISYSPISSSSFKLSQHRLIHQAKESVLELIKSSKVHEHYFEQTYKMFLNRYTKPDLVSSAALIIITDRKEVPRCWRTRAMVYRAESLMILGFKDLARSELLVADRILSGCSSSKLSSGEKGGGEWGILKSNNIKRSYISDQYFSLISANNQDQPSLVINRSNSKIYLGPTCPPAYLMTSRTGNSHIGKPLRVIDQGETMIDPVTFEDYIKGLRSSWNAQLFNSHSLELSSLRNCNNFSKEVLSFLNGSDVPDYILSLPHQFLSTPLGASMRPMIDQMFRLGSGYSNHHQISSSSNQPTTPISLLSNLTSTIHNNSNLSKGSGPRHSVNSNIKKTSRKPSREITFLAVDTTISNEICLKFWIRATPTFKFFLRNKQVAEVRGANPTELETQINLLLFTAYPSE
ncbi:expressed protein [Phakopsora pachyrhizi]|uniref:Expressed protein n=1 Tax=Phakopsora pachyrhizi TaxID=170000 RepID=A0AAV0AK00_PHAPC|nr:expressed protein [Phakopsora pachyrhizi]